MEEEIRPSAKAFEPHSFNDSTHLLFSFLHWNRPVSFLSHSNQSVHCQFVGISLSFHVWCSGLTPVWCCIFLFCIVTCRCYLTLRTHLHGSPLPSQLPLPFFFMLNSNDYFQRKAVSKAPLSSVCTWGKQATVQHPLKLLFFWTLLFCKRELLLFATCFFKFEEK